MNRSYGFHRFIGLVVRWRKLDEGLLIKRKMIATILSFHEFLTHRPFFGQDGNNLIFLFGNLLLSQEHWLRDLDNCSILFLLCGCSWLVSNPALFQSSLLYWRSRVSFFLHVDHWPPVKEIEETIRRGNRIINLIHSTRIWSLPTAHGIIF